jgi:YXWGXW repeat-containing protein
MKQTRLNNVGSPPVTAFSVLAVALCLGLTSCSQNPNPSAPQEQSSDPAQANLASADQQTTQPQAPQPAQASQQAQSSYAPQPSYQPQPTADDSYDQNYPGASDTDYEEPSVEAEQPPPPIPQYTQPECPGDNYLWTPGYWGYASAGYYWVPGVWVVAPYVGSLWTPPYWAFSSGRYHWYHGYWGPHVGYYGGINYGHGYVGRGYEGGYWNHSQFTYNRSVNTVNTTIIHNVYDYRVTNITNVRVSYVGGPAGLNVRPTPSELAVLHESRIAPVPAQVQHMRQAASNRAQFASVNNGRPQVFAAAAPLATAYRAPAPHESAVPQARALPRIAARPEPAPVQPRAQAQPNYRPAAQPAQNQRPEARSAPLPPNRPAVENRPEVRPAPQPRAEQRPAPQPRVQERPAPEPRAQQQRPAPEPRAQQQRPVPEPRVQQRPAPEAHQEVRPAPKQEPKPAPKKEERPPKREEPPR